ncbi:MAG TPA: hypothetical protein VIF57_24375, partial [Polyangia bacterium]
RLRRGTAGAPVGSGQVAVVRADLQVRAPAPARVDPPVRAWVDSPARARVDPAVRAVRAWADLFIRGCCTRTPTSRA